MRQRVAIARVLALDSAHHADGRALRRARRPHPAQPAGRAAAHLGRAGKTIVFVTHSIEEAIYLADRVVVMTYRPGTIKRDQPIALPRPRDPARPSSMPSSASWACW